ncbi:CYTH domain-containing protein [Azospirillum thermophilum]|uniref:CYTH domain-containing protein n=1 Tax=Azospirillum thermophilum TaxID=2202148 RepID=A0A2S2CS94_9PROT|nr:CYTH domain-containing protein [Azospirillum thermophilum]AWK87295.1 hypothetical protein DEW08_14670 [Azospirillum thermophilum]
MPQEIERRFLVRGSLPAGLLRPGERIVQGYLPARNGSTARVRVAGGRAFLTKKSRKCGCCRTEVERELPIETALRLINEACTGSLIIKTRHRIDHFGFLWEIDVFHGDNRGLVIAEIELPHPETVFPLPDWVGAEITTVAGYSNSALARRPLRFRPLAA